jgi:adenosylmethionine-8-amino-7-oxononanoate aminotransferase
MTFLYKGSPERGAQWARLFAQKSPDIDFHVWPETGDPAKVRYLAAWQPPEDPARTLPNLEVVFSVGAGVDQFDLSGVPDHIPVVRMIEPGIVEGMVEYVTHSVLTLHRDLIDYQLQQQQKTWNPLPVRAASSRRIGVLGLGVLGTAVLERLKLFGFACAGWSRSGRDIEGVECYAGAGTLDTFLARTDILICLLPLTDATRGMLNTTLFNKLPTRRIADSNRPRPASQPGRPARCARERPATKRHPRRHRSRTPPANPSAMDAPARADHAAHRQRNTAGQRRRSRARESATPSRRPADDRTNRSQPRLLNLADSRWRMPASGQTSFYASAAQNAADALQNAASALFHELFRASDSCRPSLVWNGHQPLSATRKIPMSIQSLIEADRKHLIHPVINYRAHEARGVTVLESASGAFLRDAEGNELLDAFSGLWCVNVGYGQPSIVKVAAEQMTRLPYATSYFHFGNAPAIELAEKLVELSPASLQHVYFTLGGSDAVDSALRFITHYFNATGRPSKKHIIALERGYHGSSAVGAGLTALPAFHRNFDVPLPNQHHIPSPYAYRNNFADDAALIAASVAALETKVAALGADNVAAFFCEPIQGSGGVIVPPFGWLKAMRETCRKLDILFVADEVITGFGRTGPLFACQAEDVQPDLMTVAKGLTAGYAPMGAVLMSDAVYQGIADGDAAAIVGHGHTYSAHPVSAAIGLEVLRLYHEGGLLENGVRHAERFARGLDALLAHPLVGDSRHRGLLGALELVSDKETRQGFDAALNLSERITAAAYRNRLVFRAFGDNILGFAPALSYTDSRVRPDVRAPREDTRRRARRTRSPRRAEA